MNSAIIQASCNCSLTLLEAASARRISKSITVLLVLGRAERRCIDAIRKHLIRNLFAVYVDVADGGYSIITRIKHLISVRREDKVVLLEHWIYVLQRVLRELVRSPLHQFIASSVFCTAHLAGRSYNTTVIALHGSIGHNLSLCTECLLA